MCAEHKLIAISQNNKGWVYVKEELRSQEVIAIFDTDRYVHSIRIAPTQSAGLERLLRCSYDSLVQVLYDKLKQDDYYLIDLMDVLDRCEIIYQYSIEAGDFIQFRPA